MRNTSLGLLPSSSLLQRRNGSFSHRSLSVDTSPVELVADLLRSNKWSPEVEKELSGQLPSFSSSQLLLLVERSGDSRRALKYPEASKGSSMSMKLDLSKAYEQLNWKFLRNFLEVLSFSQGSVKRILLCVGLDGSTSEWKFILRRVEESDKKAPLSRYVFILTMEASARHVQGGTDGWWKTPAFKSS
ncbi:uncharacterized protein LOC116246660 [Nymphaea colorata]|uniref:uncharacterized protein LOC116246660 n=1 Tax=Nymphaea colorata TaxID=210225 RepID=UPI00129E726D|nr:uncharacterized protein LOC116246660 [Nymphaea colorata]